MDTESIEGRDVGPHFLELQARLILLFETAPPRFDLYLDLLDIVAAERFWLSHNGGPWADVTDDDRSLFRQLTVGLQVRLEHLLEAAGAGGETGAPTFAEKLAAASSLIEVYATVVHRLAGSGSMPVVPGAPVH